MYEHFTGKYKFIASDTPYCAIELLEQPFTGVKLYIGREFTFSEVGAPGQTVRFDYDIFELPSGFTEDQITQEFDDLLMGIFLSILEKKMNPQAAVEDKKGGTSN